jgi:hypothetical protein
MIKSRVALAAALFATLVLLGFESLLGADSPVDETMKSHGLKRAGDLYVLMTESDVKNKVLEIRRFSKQLNYALMQQKGTLSAKDYQDTIKGLGDQINQYNNEINAVNQRINAVPRYRGRLASTREGSFSISSRAGHSTRKRRRKPTPRSKIDATIITSRSPTSANLSMRPRRNMPRLPRTPRS